MNITTATTRHSNVQGSLLRIDKKRPVISRPASDSTKLHGSSSSKSSLAETMTTKRKLTVEHGREKKLRETPPQPKRRTITHSELIIQAARSKYRPYFTAPIESQYDSDDTSSNISRQSKQVHRVTLEYPGEYEHFLLLKPVIKTNAHGKTIDSEVEDKDEYNPMCDLMRTVDFIHDDYLTPAQQKLLGDDSQGIMRNLTKYRNRRHSPGFIQAVTDFNKVIRTLKEKGELKKNAQAMRHPDYDLACHVLYQVYSRTVAHEADALNNYAAFSNNVYGEINSILVKEFISKTGITSSSVFMDLGCGIGNVVLQVAAQTGCEAYGIEIMETPCRYAKRQLKEYASRMRAWLLPTGKIHFRHGDFLDMATNGMYSTLKRADVLLVNNYAFDAATNHALAQLFLDLKEGTRIISLKSFVPKHHKINQRTFHMPESILRVEEYEYFSEAVSWTHSGGKYYLATVDRTRLEPFYKGMYGHS